MLTTSQRAQLHQRLLALKAELLTAIAQHGEAGQTVELDQTRQGRLSRMDALQGQAMAQAANTRAHRQLKQVISSLNLIQSVNYGRCEECDEPIAFARLESNPITQYCIQCAQALEDARG